MFRMSAGKPGIAAAILIFLVAIFVITGVGVGLAWRTDLLDEWLPASIKEFLGKSTAAGEQQSADEEEVAWETYIDDNAGFSLEYPQNTKLITDADSYSTEFHAADDLGLLVSATDINTLDDSNPLWTSLTRALNDREALARGEFGMAAPFGDYFNEVVVLDGVNAKTYTSFLSLTCDEIHFSRKATLYKGDYEIHIFLIAPVDKIVLQNPEYFVDGRESCGVDKDIWDFDRVPIFANDLSNRNVSDFALEWFDTFDQILSTFKFLD